MKEMEKFSKDFYDEMKTMDFKIRGLLLNDGKVLKLSDDSKLLGRIFEMIIEPVIAICCIKNDWILEPNDVQNTYPDFTITMKDGKRIALDIKTTYRSYSKNNELQNLVFTLGAYGSFLRDNTKNIMYPYDTYVAHYVIGFVYDRIPEDDCPYSNIQYFIQEKYKIAGDKPGSGNTENIGTIRTTNFNDFVEGNGLFAKLGNDVFEDYWRNYPKYRSTEKNYTDLEGYFEYKNKNKK